VGIAAIGEYAGGLGAVPLVACKGTAPGQEVWAESFMDAVQVASPDA